MISGSDTVVSFSIEGLGYGALLAVADAEPSLALRELLAFMKQRSATRLDAYPAGASPFGVLDLEGNVSQWTDEFADAHTRAAIVRGGASYRPLGSVWYFPQTDRLDEHQKYLLVSPGADRAGTIGFRCVVDAI